MSCQNGEFLGILMLYRPLKEERTVTRLAQPVYALSSSKNPLAWLDEVPVAAGQEANDLT